jgi:uncharacterized Zn finger protein (UPF0148 family)
MVNKIIPPGYLLDANALDRIVGFLNEGTFSSQEIEAADRDELRELVADWFAAEKDMQKLVETRLLAKKSVDFTKVTLNILVSGQSPVLVATPAKVSLNKYAHGVFFQFLAHPGHSLLTGPCPKDGCGKFFLRRTEHHKVYCTSAHASHTSAVKAMAKRRAVEQAEKIEAIKSSLNNWGRLKRQYDWKKWVESETGTSSRSLARLINGGLITAPQERKRNAKETSTPQGRHIRA